MPNFSLAPDPLQGAGDIVAGDASCRNRDTVLIGRLAESGRSRKLWLDTSGEQVIAIFGKRGTGKSYTLGVILEALASGDKPSDLAKLATPRATLLFDIMDIFWSSTLPLTDAGPPELKKQHQVMHAAGYKPRPLNIDVWVPAGFHRPEVDPLGLKTLRLQAADFELDDWAALFEVDLYNEPRGMLLSDLTNLVRNTGYEKADGTFVSSNASFTFEDILTCINSSQYIADNYRDDTIRSIKQRLSSYSGLELFRGTPTDLCDLLRPWRASVLMLARLPDGLKQVLVAVLLRRIMRARQDASFAQKRLDMDATLSAAERTKLESFIANSVPRTTVMMDEAHILAGKEQRSVACEAFVRYSKEGRNIGLSLILATQQPSAVDARIMSQVETMLVHQLTAPADANVAHANMRSPIPGEIKIDSQTADVPALLRRLPQGIAVFSSGNAPSLNRLCVTTVRPRITAHGGYEA